jgi:hypothetical protein
MTLPSARRTRASAAATRPPLAPNPRDTPAARRTTERTLLQGWDLSAVADRGSSGQRVATPPPSSKPLQILVLVLVEKPPVITNLLNPSQVALAEGHRPAGRGDPPVDEGLLHTAALCTEVAAPHVSIALIVHSNSLSQEACGRHGRCGDRPAAPVWAPPGLRRGRGWDVGCECDGHGVAAGSTGPATTRFPVEDYVSGDAISARC